MKSESVNRVLSETFDRVEDLAEQMSIKVDSQTDILGVMEKANQALARINASIETSFQGLLDHVNQYDRSLTRLSEDMARERKDILQNTLDAVAHEIRNPLLAIGGFARRLAGQATEEDRGRKYATIIAQESARLESVLREMIEYSKVYAPTLSQKDLLQIIDEALSGLDEFFREKNIDVVREFPQRPVLLTLETDGISRIFEQVFKNAVSMIDPNGGRVIVSVKRMGGPGEVLISVSDNGRQIPDDIRDALLDSNPSAKTFEGGLGMPLARKIIEAHKGRIEIEARTSRGNTVNIYLPISERG
jgi:signal transduction histidine kinase